MSSMSIGIGLTHLRKYNFVQTGLFYSSLYSITTGIERLLKLIVIYDHRLNNDGEFPDNKQLKDFGHVISKLFDKAIEINEINNFTNDTAFIKSDEIYGKIISIMSDFAVQARYYNLDFITGKIQNTVEPLLRWNQEVNSLIIARHYKQNPKRINEILAVSTLMEDISDVMHTYEDGSDINSVKDLYLLGDLVTTKQKYSVYYLYVIIRYLSNLCLHLEYLGNFYPMLHEYFMIFRHDDDSYVLRKKSWNPNPPYHF